MTRRISRAVVFALVWPLALLLPAPGALGTTAAQVREIVPPKVPPATARQELPASLAEMVTVAALSLGNAPLSAGQTATGSVTLASAAPRSGAVVTLTSASPTVSVPPTVAVAAGATTATFLIMVQKTAPPGNVLISAAAPGNGGTPKQALLGIVSSAQVTMVDFVANASSLDSCIGNNYGQGEARPGYACQGQVRLDQAAPAGGLKVVLASSLKSVAVDAAVVVPPGALTGVFNVTVAATADTGTGVISAVRDAPGATPKQATIKVLPRPQIATFTVTPNAEPGGTITGRVELDGRAPRAGMRVTLASSSAAVTVPADVTLSATKSATFSATVAATASQGSVTIGAVIPGSSVAGKNASTNIVAAQVYDLFFYSPVGSSNAIIPGRTSTGTLSLTAKVGAAVTIMLSSSNPDVTVPPSVVVPAGSSQVGFTATARTAAAPGTAQITAVRAGTGNTAKQATLPIRLVQVSKVEVPGVTVKMGQTQTGTLTLDAPADPGGIVVALRTMNTFDPPAHVTVPASVTVPAGATSTTFTITAISVGNGTTILAVRAGQPASEEKRSNMNVSVQPQ